jgi:hypothetical protein
MPTAQEIIESSGDVFLPRKISTFLSKDIIGSHNKTFYISYWSLIHLFSGIVCGYIVAKYFTKKTGNIIVDNFYTKLFIIHLIWELWQILIGMSNPHNLIGRNNIVDTMVDTILFMAGGYFYNLFK